MCIDDYKPLMDRYPELRLRPITEFPSHNLIQKFDYVQNLNDMDKDSLHGYFYLLVKDGKYGIYMYDPGTIFSTTTIALKAIYESIEIIRNEGRAFGAIVRKKGKYGMIFWKYGLVFNHVYKVPTEYDSLVRINNGNFEGERYKAIKDNKVTYFDYVGHILK